MPKKRKKTPMQQQAQTAQRTRRRRMRLVRTIAIWTLIIGGSIAGVVFFTQRSIEHRPGEHQNIEGRDHIDPRSERPQYGTNPPTSGAHGNALPWRVYTTEVADENAVHNLEHGGIWITYKGLDKEQVAQLETIARRHPRSVLLSLRAANDAPIAVASWGRLMKLDTVDRAKIEEYIAKNINKSPEPLAR